MILGNYLLQYTIPLSARRSTSAQSNPAPAEANILQETGIKGMRSLSHLPISPPVFQNGRNIAAKLPHLLDFKARINSSCCRSFKDGRITMKSSENFSKNAVFHLTGSPMCNTMGFSAVLDVSVAMMKLSPAAHGRR